MARAIRVKGGPPLAQDLHSLFGKASDGGRALRRSVEAARATAEIYVLTHEGLGPFGETGRIFKLVAAP